MNSFLTCDIIMFLNLFEDDDFSISVYFFLFQEGVKHVDLLTLTIPLRSENVILDLSLNR